MIDIDAIVRRVEARGPVRVLIGADGPATSPGRLPSTECPPVRWVYVRGDGWTLGASDRLREAARDQWPDEWVALLEIDHQGRVVRRERLP